MNTNKNKSKKEKRTSLLKYYIIPILILIFSGLAIFLLINKFGSEDCWICENGEWIKHGQPNMEMPKENCGGAKKEDKIKCESYSPEKCPEECVVCPPCPECSSVSCQSQEFCAKMGIDRDWYEKIKNVSAKNDFIRLTSPLPEQKITSPLKIAGEARGTWFFEGSFPVILTDWDGLIIAQGIAKADGEWMTEDFVKFSAELNFEKPAYSNNGLPAQAGTLILKKDNPSGLPKYDDSLEIPVIFE